MTAVVPHKGRPVVFERTRISPYRTLEGKFQSMDLKARRQSGQFRVQELDATAIVTLSRGGPCAVSDL